MPKPKNLLPTLLILLLCFLKNETKAQLKADFSVNINAGCSPLSVSFTDLSTGGPTSWEWDLGDGNPQPIDKQNPGNIYLTPGSYNITLTVKNGSETSTITKNALITVYAKPTLQFSSLPPSEGCAPITVKFSNQATAGSGTLKSVVWDFGDGTIFSGNNPSHTYTNPGTPTVTLTAENSFGCKQTLQKSDVVNVYNNANANFNYTYTSPCKPPTIVTFKNLSTSNNPMTYHWNFGDGKEASTNNPVHSYDNPGTYNTRLVATTDQGCTDTLIKKLTIGAAGADFIVPEAQCANVPITFVNSSSLQPISVSWNFGDGQTANTVDATHSFANPGTYQVTMIADFGECNSAITKPVTVSSKPKADFATTGNIVGCNFPASIQFSNKSTGAVNYKWLFGDNSSSEEANPTHTYSAQGSYTVTLIAINASGCSDTLVKTSFVQLGPPVIDSIQNLPIEGCSPQTITPKASITTGEPITSYVWNFGDGTSSTEAAPTHTYSAFGTYSVSLTVSTASGCADTLSLANAVSIGIRPKAGFSADPLIACTTKTINFTNESTGETTDWLWNFGDSSTSRLKDPMHKYTDTGKFTITLIAISNGCNDTLVIPDYITIQPPIAKIDKGVICSDKYKRTFNSKSIGAKKVLWDFGDGTTSTANNTAHVYTATGKYYVTLTVTNGECSDQVVDSVHIVDQSPTFSIAPSEICKYDTVAFTANNFDLSGIAGFHWNFDDGSFLGFNINNKTAKHKYNDAGSYNPFMIVRYLNGCKDTVYLAPAKLNVYGPTADFSNEEGTCVNNAVTFIDQTITDSAHKVAKWIWDFGDGSAVQTYVAPPFNHTYTTADSFDVKLVVFDNLGCKDSITKQNGVIITKPLANFTTVDPLRCTSSEVEFLDSSAGPSLSYNWNFGDGKTSTEQNPAHLFATQGTYSISLRIKDKYGCTDSITKVDYVTISNPKASFTLTDTFGVCPPLLVKPENTSTNFSSLNWDFDDGVTSELTDPEHLYITAGTYILTLTAKGYGECYDSAKQKVVIRGPSGKFSYSTTTGCSPVTVNFNATTTNADSLIWGFGDGVVEPGKKNSVTHTYESYGKYSPRLVLVDTNGCKVGITNLDTITVSGVKANFVVSPQSGCDSALVSFTDSSLVYYDTINTYQWDFGDGAISGEANPNHYYANSGTYSVTLTVSTSAGCVDTATSSAMAEVNESPQINISSPDSSCVLSPVNLIGSAITSDSLNWEWKFGNGSTSGDQNATATYSSSGVYNISLKAVNESGCTDTASTKINILPAPPINAGLDTFLCLGNSTVLQATGAESFVWTSSPSLSCFNCSNPAATPATSTTFYVEGSSAFGCKAVDSVLVIVKQPTQLSVKTSDTLCIGESLQLSASGAEVYSWQPATGLNNPNIANPIAAPTATTTYTLTGADDKNCFSDTKEVTINVYPIPAFNILDSLITLNLGSKDTLQTTSSPDVIRWEWSPPKWLDCINCAEPVIQPKGEITYTARASNEAGCSVADQVTIKMVCNGSNIFVPNTFSPNSDGMNDQFFPRANADISIRSLRIFNRWGQLIFEKINPQINNPVDGWDGKYQNNIMPEGVYVYFMEIICDKNGVFQLKGNTTLIR